MRNVYRNTLLCLLVTALFVMPISAVKNETKVSSNNIHIQHTEFLPGEFIVKFKDSPIHFTHLDILNEKCQVHSMEKIFQKSGNTILDNIYLVKVPKDSDILSIIEEYASHPDVIYAEPNGIAHPFIIPNDPYFPVQWYLDNTGQESGTPDCDIDAPEAWEKMVGSPDIVIAIVDSGIDFTHPDLADNIWINEDEIPDNNLDDDENGYVDDVRGWDFAYNDNDPMDLNGHGTICAGVVGAICDNGIGSAGVCWNCKIMDVQISNYKWVGSFTDIASGIQYAADNGANVISLSFGWYNKNDEIIKDACEYANDIGVVLVAAAGNDGVSAKACPASFENVISVAGTNNNDSILDTFSYGEEVKSNYGLWVDVAAPGQHIYSTMPTYTVYFNEEYGMNMNYTYASGTSLSAPIVAGVVGLMLSKNSSLSPDEVTKLIRKSVDRYHSIYYLGTGRIDAYKAMTKAKVKDDTHSTDTVIERLFYKELSIHRTLIQFFESHPHLFPILRQILLFLG